jgi:hypothetical protein
VRDRIYEGYKRGREGHEGVLEGFRVFYRVIFSRVTRIVLHWVIESCEDLPW